MDLPFNQTFDLHDLLVVLLLVVLEGALSIDNALVLGLLARRLPKSLQGRALTYGLVGAFVFRLLAIATATYLLRWRIVKLLGGAYLIYVAIKHLFFDVKDRSNEKLSVDASGHPILVDPQTGQPLSEEEVQAEMRERSSIPSNTHSRKFWATVGVIEVTDIAFAVDSILAAIALVGPAPAETEATAFHPKLWVIVIGGMLGVILMRVAAVVFIRLLDRFPRFELAAYLLVLVIGLKLSLDWAFNSSQHPHRLNFHDYHTAPFWIFWILMLLCLAVGFIPQRKRPVSPA
jgi:YkoY family integral membrane protein